MIMKKRGREEEEEKSSLGKKQRSIYRRDEEWGWMRGKLLGVGGYGSVSEAIIPGKSRSRPPQFKDFPSLLAVKSAHQGSSYADLIMEKVVYTALGSSPHILKYYGHDHTFSEEHDGSYGGIIYNLFLENALGGSLSGLIEKTKAGLLESQARVHTRSILKGLELIHHKGFVHCDIKPSNILMVHCDDDNPHGVDGLVAKIADFGLSKGINDDFEKEKRVRGTSLYLSPESVCEETQDQASDIWALGCVVLEMLTGSPPWDVNLGQEELFSKISTETPSLPSYLTFTAQDFLLECFTRDPNQRPSAQMLLNHSFAMKWEEDSEEEDPEEEDSEEEDPKEDPEEGPTQRKIPKKTQRKILKKTQKKIPKK
ncbi:mitogen-activated protein kinase kinase kinase 20 [Cannabis sativa]|uniref:mitogen-activated protein kinase kinase kinase 20 n=1 Tax=Cannabis sativa TaxID=3483 RepID=UPI0029CA158B|nr:mitogen-activated protein kinase kinase kinase 20 [Cannabis sativa]